MTSCERSFEAQARYHEKLVVEFTAEDMAIVKDAFHKARRESGKRDRRSLLLHMARAFLRGLSPDTEAKKTSKPPYQVIFHHHLPSGLSWCETEKGERPIPPETLTKALCDAEINEAGDNPGNEFVTQGQEEGPLRNGVNPLEKLDEGMAFINELYGRKKRAKPHDSPGNKKPLRRARRTIPRKVRKHVLDRDGHCCPPCGGRQAWGAAASTSRLFITSIPWLSGGPMTRGGLSHSAGAATTWCTTVR